MSFTEAADKINSCNWIVVLCGAGFSADSGVATYRGINSDIEVDKDVWPPIRDGQETFYSMAKERRYRLEPKLAWGYTYNRVQSLKKVKPHAGYHILHDMIKDKPHFVFSTNIDSMWDGIVDPNCILEYHGTLSNMQCINDCQKKTQPLVFEDDAEKLYDANTGLYEGLIPTCTDCGEIMRPNTFMINDSFFSGVRRFKQQDNYNRFKRHQTKGRGLVMEIGCGVMIPTAKTEGVTLCNDFSVDHIIINPDRREDQKPSLLTFNAGALETLIDIQRSM